jgi:hypothetical protein
VDSAVAKLELNLAHLRVTQFNLEIAAGNCELKMSSSARITQSFIETNAANIEADVNVGALEIDESRFPKNGAYYIFPNFEDLESRIKLKIDCNAGRVKVI